jgi:hypothetical protein
MVLESPEAAFAAAGAGLQRDWIIPRARNNQIAESERVHRLALGWMACGLARVGVIGKVVSVKSRETNRRQVAASICRRKQGEWRLISTSLEFNRMKRLPSEEDLSVLPLRAIVSLAARCGRRVQVLYAAHWLSAPSSKMEAIDEALKFAEDVGSGIVFTFKKGVTSAAYGAGGATRVAPAAKSAFAAATAAVAARAALADDRSETLRAGRESIFTAGRAYASISLSVAERIEGESRARAGLGPVADAIRQDFRSIKTYSENTPSNDSGSFPPKLFGPLWPNGPPSNWPIAAEQAPVSGGGAG